MKFMNSYLGGGFKYLLFSSLFGEIIQFDEYFSDGLVQPPTSYEFSPFLKRLEPSLFIFFAGWSSNQPRQVARQRRQATGTDWMVAVPWNLQI